MKLFAYEKAFLAALLVAMTLMGVFMFWTMGLFGTSARNMTPFLYGIIASCAVMALTILFGPLGHWKVKSMPFGVVGMGSLTFMMVYFAVVALHVFETKDRNPYFNFLQNHMMPITSVGLISLAIYWVFERRNFRPA